MTVPSTRVRLVGEAPVRAGGRHVLYWMTAHRRTRHNFALERALDWCRELGRPLLVLEALRCDHLHASDRLHRFVLDGMRDNASDFEKAGVRYHPYVERTKREGKGLLEALASDACVVVGDDAPVFFLPRMVEAAARRLDVALEVVDACGLLPLSATDRAHPTAYAFRRHLQKTLPAHLEARPRANPLARADVARGASVPQDVLSRWGRAPKALLEAEGASGLGDLPIDHEVTPVRFAGGSRAGRARLRRFVADRLAAYDEERNHPDRHATSGLSPYLHFGHVAADEVFDAVVRAEGWSLDDLGTSTDGKRSGWWGLSPSAEAFLDQLVTWRELGFHFCRHRPDADGYESLPDWARATLARHASDDRPYRYDRAAFEEARTHDDLWNAAQRELRREGTIHNYLRMLWGKMILGWSRSPEEAWATLFHLNDRWAIDGRDPNSTSGLAWCLGRFDRPWGPERPVFGTVRYMTSANTRRKVHLREYMASFRS